MTRPEEAIIPVTLAAAGVLAAAYVWVRRQTAVERWLGHRWLSAASGVSAAYVFMDILPELEVRRLQFLQIVGHDALFVEQIIYLAALFGFVVFYGLNHLVLPSASGADTPARRDRTDAAFWVRVGGYGVYSWVIGYIVIERAELGTHVLALYVVAIALHVTVVGSALARRHGCAYARVGARVLAACVLAGWLTGVTATVPDVAFPWVFAFVAGAIIMTSVSEELPGKQGSFRWLLGGATVYALILLVAR